MRSTYSLAVYGILLCFFAFLLGVWLTKLSVGADIDWPKTFESLSHVATVTGVVGAAFWTVHLIRRRGSLTPRAQLVHRHQVWQAESQKYLRIYIEIQNPSEVTLYPGNGKTWIQAVPKSPIDSNEYAVEQWTDLVKIIHPIVNEDVWIEPKESETYCHDVLLEQSLRYVQIHTALRCSRKLSPIDKQADDEKSESEGSEEDKDFGDATYWHLTTLIDLLAV